MGSQTSWLNSVAVRLFLVIASLGFNQPNALSGAMAEDPRRAGGTGRAWCAER